MKILPLFQRPPQARHLVWVLASFLTTAVQAHPGHPHPDETDEFDFLTSMFLHSHGSLDYLLAAVVAGSLAVAVFHGRPAVRITAIGAALASLAMLPVL